MEMLLFLILFIHGEVTVDEPQREIRETEIRERDTETKRAEEPTEHGELAGSSLGRDTDTDRDAEGDEGSGRRHIHGEESISEVILGKRAGNTVDRVSYCESGQTNSENSVSSASGYFQFIDSTWSWVTDLEPPASSYSLEIQTEAFHKLWDNGNGASHWAPSEYCWQYESPWDHHIRP